MVRYDAVRYCIWYGRIRCGTVRYDTVWYSMVRYDMVLYGEIRYGTVWPVPAKFLWANVFFFSFFLLFGMMRDALWDDARRGGWVGVLFSRPISFGGCLLVVMDVRYRNFAA